MCEISFFIAFDKNKSQTSTGSLNTVREVIYVIEVFKFKVQ